MQLRQHRLCDSCQPFCLKSSMPPKNPYASAAISVTVAVIAAMPAPVSAYTTTMCNSHQIKNVSGLAHTYSSQPSASQSSQPSNRGHIGFMLVLVLARRVRLRGARLLTNFTATLCGCVGTLHADVLAHRHSGGLVLRHVTQHLFHIALLTKNTADSMDTGEGVNRRC